MPALSQFARLSSRFRAVRTVLWLLTAAWLIPTPVAGQASREYDVKAAFLFNFASFVEWPPEAFPSADSPFIIGVLGSDPFGRSLDEIVSGEQLHNRKLVVHRFSRVEDMHRCHILFISASESAELRTILDRLRGQPVLTVGDSPGFAEDGGAIGFATGRRISLVVNESTIRAANLTVSAKLLRLAQVIREGVRP